MKNLTISWLLAGLFLFPIEMEAQINRSRYKQKDNKQALYKRKQEELFPSSLQHEMSGWLFGLGFTYFGAFGYEKDNVKYVPTGLFGYYGEFGRYKLYEYNEIIKYIDYGVAVKMFSGQEEVEGGASPGKSNFTDHTASVYFNVNNVIGFTPINFVQNTLGAKADIAFAQIREGANATTPEFLDRLTFTLHYKLGIGVKVTKSLMVIPSVEVPLIHFHPNIPRPTLPYFSSNYYPIIISVRFLFLRKKDPEACPPVYNPANPTDMQEMYNKENQR